MDESTIGIWLWIAFLIEVNATWILMDLWLHAHHHEYLTTEFKEGLRNQYLGPLLAGLVAFTIVAFIVHMLTGPSSK